MVFAPVEEEPDPLGADELLGVDDEDAPDDDEPLGEAEGLLDDEVLLI